MPNSSHSREQTTCPHWCKREHRAADHPDDRYHRSAVAVIPGTSGEGHPIEVVVYAASDDRFNAPRLIIEESERPRRLTLSWPTAADVVAAVQRTVGLVNESG